MILVINYDIIIKNFYWWYIIDEEGWGWGVFDYWV